MKKRRRVEPNAIAVLITLLACVFVAFRPLANHHHHNSGQVTLAVTVAIIAVSVMAVVIAEIIRGDTSSRGHIGCGCTRCRQGGSTDGHR